MHLMMLMMLRGVVVPSCCNTLMEGINFSKYLLLILVSSTTAAVVDSQLNLI